MYKAHRHTKLMVLHLQICLIHYISYDTLERFAIFSIIIHFFTFSGDLPAHDVWMQSQHTNIHVAKVVFWTFKTYVFFKYISEYIIIHVAKFVFEHFNKNFKYISQSLIIHVANVVFKKKIHIHFLISTHSCGKGCR